MVYFKNIFYFLFNVKLEVIVLRFTNYTCAQKLDLFQLQKHTIVFFKCICIKRYSFEIKTSKHKKNYGLFEF